MTPAGRGRIAAAMCRRTGQVARLRAIIGVIALYGLLLQGALAGMARYTPAAGPGVLPLCAPEHGAPAGHDGGSAHDHGCCLAACGAAPPALAPDAAAYRVTWPARARLIRAAYRLALPDPTGPPVDATSPRGPPTEA